MRTAALVALAITSLALLARAAPPDPKVLDMKPPARSVDPIFYLPKRLNLSDEQQEKLRDLRRAYKPKLEALQLEANDILTSEQRKVADQARQRAPEDGKRGRQVHEAVLEALAAQGAPTSVRAKYRRALSTQVALLHEIHQKKLALLTQEQRD